ncbi:hypothetical protein AB0F72_28650 [Actinoplanes sp. NPDC023936]
MYGDADGTCTADTDIPGDIADQLPPGFTLPASTSVQVATAIS